MRKLFLSLLVVAGLTVACEQEQISDLHFDLSTTKIKVDNLEREVAELRSLVSSEIAGVLKLVSNLDFSTQEQFAQITADLSASVDALAAADASNLALVLQEVADTEQRLLDLITDNAEAIQAQIVAQTGVNANLEAAIADAYSSLSVAILNLKNTSDGNLQTEIDQIEAAIASANTAIAANTQAIADLQTELLAELDSLIEAFEAFEDRTETQFDNQVANNIAQEDYINRVINRLIVPLQTAVSSNTLDIAVNGGEISELITDLGNVITLADVIAEINSRGFVNTVTLEERLVEVLADAAAYADTVDTNVDISGLESAVEGLTSDLSSLTGRVDSLNGVLDTLTSLQDQIDALPNSYITQADIDATVDALELSLSSSITTLETTLATYANVLSEIAALQAADTAAAGDVDSLRDALTIAQGQIGILNAENQADATFIAGLMTSVTNLQNLINALVADNDLVDANGFVIADVAMLESNGFVLVPGTPVAYQLTQDDGRVYIVSLNPAGQLIVDGPNGWTDVYDTVSNPGSGSSSQDGVIEGIARQNEVLDAEEAADMLAAEREAALTDALDNIGSIPTGFTVSRTGNVFTVLRAEDGWTEDITATFVDGSSTPIFNFLGGNNSNNLHTAVTRTADSAPPVPVMFASVSDETVNVVRNQAYRLEVNNGNNNPITWVSEITHHTTNPGAIGNRSNIGTGQSVIVRGHGNAGSTHRVTASQDGSADVVFEVVVNATVPTISIVSTDRSGTNLVVAFGNMDLPAGDYTLHYETTTISQGAHITIGENGLDDVPRDTGIRSGNFTPGETLTVSLRARIGTNFYNVITSTTGTIN